MLSPPPQCHAVHAVLCCVELFSSTLCCAHRAVQGCPLRACCAAAGLRGLHHAGRPAAAAPPAKADSPGRCVPHGLHKSLHVLHGSLHRPHGLLWVTLIHVLRSLLLQQLPLKTTSCTHAAMQNLFTPCTHAAVKSMDSGLQAQCCITDLLAALAQHSRLSAAESTQVGITLKRPQPLFSMCRKLQY